MANYKESNVIVCDTSAQFTGQYEITTIKYVGGTAGAANIRGGSSSGNILWEESGSANTHGANLDIVIRNGFYVTVSGTGTKVYIYLE